MLSYETDKLVLCATLYEYFWCIGPFLADIVLPQKTKRTVTQRRFIPYVGLLSLSVLGMPCYFKKA